MVVGFVGGRSEFFWCVGALYHFFSSFFFRNEERRYEIFNNHQKWFWGRLIRVIGILLKEAKGVCIPSAARVSIGEAMQAKRVP